MDYTQKLKKQFMMACVISYTILVGVFIFGIVAYASVQNAQAPIRSPNNTEQLRLVFAIVSIAGLGAIRFIKTALLNRTGSVYRNQSEGLDPQTIVLSRLSATHVVVCAICETPALFGLVLTMMTRNMSDFYLFAWISVMALLFNLPKYREWEEKLNKVQFKV